MSAGTGSRVGVDSERAVPSAPEVSVCETRPGRSVFLEAGNSDGWISTDVTVDVTR